MIRRILHRLATALLLPVWVVSDWWGGVREQRAYRIGKRIAARRAKERGEDDER